MCPESQASFKSGFDFVWNFNVVFFNFFSFPLIMFSTIFFSFHPIYTAKMYLILEQASSQSVPLLLFAINCVFQKSFEFWCPLKFRAFRLMPIWP